MLPPAPGLLSTITGCFVLSETFCARSRATVSSGPPAGYGTTNRIGFDGYGCASAKPALLATTANVTESTEIHGDHGATGAMERKPFSVGVTLAMVRIASLSLLVKLFPLPPWSPWNSVFSVTMALVISVRERRCRRGGGLRPRHDRRRSRSVDGGRGRRWGSWPRECGGAPPRPSRSSRGGRCRAGRREAGRGATGRAPSS